MRASRSSTNEPPLTRLVPLVQALSQSLRQEMELPFAFFGHSLGGLIAFELARQLRREGACCRCISLFRQNAVRADMELCNTYVCDPEPPLLCPITAFGGLQDHKSGRACLEGWQNYTTGSFTLRMFPAGHCFLQTCERSILEAIFRELTTMDGYTQALEAPKRQAQAALADLMHTGKVGHA